MIEIKACIQEVNAPIKACMQEVNEPIRADASSSLIYAISPTVKIEDEPEDVRITATDRDGTTNGVVTKGVNNYEKLNNLPKISDKVIKGNKSLEYYGLRVITNLELESLLK